MENPPKSLRELFNEAENLRSTLDSSTTPTNSTSFQENLASAISTYEECLRVANRISLFSPNETLEDINSSNLQYLLLNFHLAELEQRITGGDRRGHVEKRRGLYEKCLKLLDMYDLLGRADARLYEEYLDSTAAAGGFSITGKGDAVARRELKISRFKEEKELKRKLEHLRQNPLALQNDDDGLRDLHLTSISLAIHQTFQQLESLALESQILAMAPPAPARTHPDQPPDARERNGTGANGYSDRLDTPLSRLNNLQGPILSKEGKPLRPFTLLDKRTELRQGVFRPDHSLPTMSIDEYLEEEKKRGGIIEGGGEASGIRPEPDEDNYAKGEEETMKARAWDDFTEENPKGSGNTLNRG
ncbi:phosphatase 2A-associated protein [Tothia fuscella]|uniref:Phosphatase 2A-associated protein n=1 Tax=Tothia fuscella TaxID=1048955 RepID=A0A9P4NJF5_9PEZI|nr:phosphatase 2A-associated protein [Tothia fuscella]